LYQNSKILQILGDSARIEILENKIIITAINFIWQIKVEQA
jgi:hypothetical protein